MTIDLLIADDHEVVRAGLKTLLEGTDVRIVAEATGGDAALKLAKKHKPMLVLLDVRMPDGNGLDCLARIKLEAMRHVHENLEPPTLEEGFHEVIEFSTARSEA